ncbi:MAG TPA: DUF4168 domain-containing protein [Candidatus Caenarcaniphilales bacterium]
MLKQFFTGGSVVALLLLGSLSALAQTAAPQGAQPKVQAAPQAPVSPAELQKFANAVKQLREIQQKSQTDMVKAVQGKKLTEARFIEIYQAQQNAEAQPKAQISPQEKQSFTEAFGEISKIQQQTQANMKQVVEKEGFTVERFNVVYTTVRQKPELQKQVQQMLQS